MAFDIHRLCNNYACDLQTQLDSPPQITKMTDDADVLPSMPRSKLQPIQKPVVAPSSVPVLADFLSNVPPQLTSALVHLAPHISQIAYLAQVTSWTTSWYDSWLALAAWWAVCLLAEPTLRSVYAPIFIPLCANVLVQLFCASSGSRGNLMVPFVSQRQTIKPCNNRTGLTVCHC